MDENKVKQLLYEQRPVPCQAFNARITRQINRLVKEEKIMKKKVSMFAVVLAVLLSLALFGAVAEILGLNLFEFFGKDEPRLMELAPKAVLDTVSTIEVTSPQLGKTEASINSAYYDGQTLLVAYAIKNSQSMEEFTPTSEQLTAMQKQDNPLVIQINDPEQEPLLVQWNKAVTEGKPFGFTSHSISVSDHTLTDDGIDLPPITSSDVYDINGALYTIREYESPLPKEAQDRNSLNISIKLSQISSTRYYDGKTLYESHQTKELEPMRAIVHRTQEAIKELTGNGLFEGKPIHIKALVSPAVAKITVTLEDGQFEQLPTDTWYGAYLRDEEGRVYRAEGAGVIEGGQMTVSFTGTGVLPQQLEVRLLVETELESGDAHAPIPPSINLK